MRWGCNLGKTITAIGTINAIPEIHRVLVVTKASLKRNWERELKKWLVRPLSVGIADSKCFPSTDVVVINYDITHKFVKRMEFFWDLIICDEAHFCKSAKSRRAKAIFGYKPTRNESANGMLPTSGIPAKRKLLLTGTPFENKPAEIYPLIRYLMGDACMSKSAYEKKYCGAGMNGFGWQANGASNLEGLNQWLRANILLRRLKKDVLKELPPKTRLIIELESDSVRAVVTNEQKVCKQFEADLARAQVNFELIKCLESDVEYDARRKELNKQFYIPFTEIAKVRHETALSKVPLAVEAIQDDIAEIGSNKILVFAHHSDVLKGLAKHFPNSVTITGETPLDERDRIVQRFQNDPTCGPFFGSIRATGEGLTLTAASLVIFVEEDWVPGKISQCEDRAHRIGQKDNVLVKHLVLKGTMDAKMVTTNVRKQEVLDVALDDKKDDERMAEPVLVPRHEPLATRREIRIESSIVDAAQANECHAAVKDFVAEMDGDDDVGEVDMAIAKELAGMASLTSKFAVLARKVCIRYKSKFSRDISACGGWQGNSVR